MHSVFLFVYLDAAFNSFDVFCKKHHVHIWICIVSCIFICMCIWMIVFAYFLCSIWCIWSDVFDPCAGVKWVFWWICISIGSCILIACYCLCICIFICLILVPLLRAFCKKKTMYLDLYLNVFCLCIFIFGFSIKCIQSDVFDPWGVKGILQNAWGSRETVLN